MKKFFRPLLLILILVLITALVAVSYRRYKIGQLHNNISELQKTATEVPAPINSEYDDHKGIVHVHTALGGHSTGGFEELIAAANTNELDFVLMTEHSSDIFDTSALTLNGLYGKTLFVGGNEVNTAKGDRFLILPGSKEASDSIKMQAEEFVEKFHNGNRLVLVTHPERFTSWETPYDGIEVFNPHANSDINWIPAVSDLFWSFWSFPELTLATHYRRPDAFLAKYDEIAANRKIALTSGIDAHSNIGIHLFGDDTGKKFFNIKVDPFETIFRLNQVHILFPKGMQMNEENLISEFKKGNMYVSFGVLSDPKGFAFWAEGKNGKAQMGEEMMLSEGTKIKAVSPQKCRFVVFRNGGLINEAIDTNELELEVKEPGTYRIEAYLDQIGPPFDELPWIMSNPIYIK